MAFRLLTLLLLFNISFQGTTAQYAGLEDAKFENYTPRNGLPSDYIEIITQDKFGFIWLSTHNGLIRFDGIQFKTYLHNNSDENSLPDNDAGSIIGDGTGKVWIASRKGLFYYNYPQDNFIKVEDSGKSINWATSLVMDLQNRLWFYSNNGIYHIDCKTLAITAVKASYLKDSSYHKHSLFSTRQGNIWYCNKGLYLFDTLFHTFKKQTILNEDAFIFKAGIQDIFEESKNELCIASFFGMYQLNIANNTIQKIPYHNKSKTNNGLFINSFSYCPQLTGDSILLCTTFFEGLVMFNLHTKQFIKSFLQDNYDASSIGGSWCYYSFTDRDNILWVSHINGLSKLDWHDQQIKSYRIKEMVDSNRMLPIRKIIPDRNSQENYWLITWEYGVLFYNKISNKVIRHYQQPTDKNISILFNYDGVYDNNGNLWIGSEIGLSYFNSHRDKFINIKPSTPLHKGDTVISRILKDNKNNLWLGTEGGLWKFNIPQKKFHK